MCEDARALSGRAAKFKRAAQTFDTVTHPDETQMFGLVTGGYRFDTAAAVGNLNGQLAALNADGDLLSDALRVTVGIVERFLQDAIECNFYRQRCLSIEIGDLDRDVRVGAALVNADNALDNFLQGEIVEWGTPMPDEMPRISCRAWSSEFLTAFKSCSS